MHIFFIRNLVVAVLSIGTYAINLNVCRAQDTILLVNGDYFTGRYIEENDVFISMLRVNVRGKSKVIAVDRNDIYSIKIQDKTERIIYTRDTSDQESWDVESMRRYIRGEQIAKQYYKTNVSVEGAVAAGGVGAYLGFAGLLVPVVYLGVMGIQTPSKKHMPEIVDDEVVIAGFRDEARRIRNRNMAKGILGGIVVGWTIKVLSGGLD